MISDLNSKIGQRSPSNDTAPNLGPQVARLGGPGPLFWRLKGSLCRRKTPTQAFHSLPYES
jgi:hypothetical protein